MKRRRPPIISSLLILACHASGDAGGGSADLETADPSPTSSSTDPPTTSPPTTSATASTSTGAPMGTTSTGSTDDGSSGGSSTADEGPASSSGTTEPAPSSSCGDGILDPGEACDLGAANNDDQGACTNECAIAVCGDQLIWAGQESCDNGPDNNDSVYGGCTTQCQHGPRCGDGELQGPEECDLGPANGSGEFPPNSVPCTNGCRYAAKIAFLSSVAYTGGELNGASGAHEKCRKLAQDAGLDNALNFKAWISDAAFTPAHPEKGFTKTAGTPYVRLDGVRVAKDWNALIVYGPENGITVTETSAALLGAHVWTGTAPSGEIAPDTNTCQSWNSSKAADKGRVGISGVDKQQQQQWVDGDYWTSYTAFSCINTYRVYCFEQ